MIALKKLAIDSCTEILQKNILPFWIERMVDEEQGGFFGRIDGNNVLHPQADKGVILNARILWTFAAAYQKVEEKSYLNMAVRAYEYLLSCFMDTEHGGFYWMVDYQGKVKDTKKQIYAQAFVLYALAEFYQVTQDEKVLKLAITVFKVIEKYSFDRQHLGYLEAFDQNWNLLSDLRLSDKDANEAKTMNTHLHVLEAYTNLYRIWQNAELRTQLEKLIRLFLDAIISESGHFHLFFDERWNLRSTHFSYGHDIEGGWLLLRAAEVCENHQLIAECKQAAITLTNAALEGMDEDGGLMNEGSLHQVVDTDKHWWPQAEALVGLINAYQLSGNDKYFYRAEHCWDFIQNKLIDQDGEWHWMVHKDGSVNRNEDKAGPWKCPYHNGRAMLEMMDRLEKITNDEREF